MMTKLPCLCLAIGLAVAAQAQSQAGDSVKAVVNSLFDAMRQADSAKITAAFWPGATLQTIGRARSGADSLRQESLERFARSVGTAKAGTLDEQIQFEQVLVDGAIAIAWTPYKFYLNGQFSHCGVNCFQLVRQQGVWKINHLIDTRRKSDCP